MCHSVFECARRQVMVVERGVRRQWWGMGICSHSSGRRLIVVVRRELLRAAAPLCAGGWGVDGVRCRCVSCVSVFGSSAEARMDVYVWECRCMRAVVCAGVWVCG